MLKTYFALLAAFLSISANAGWHLETLPHGSGQLRVGYYAESTTVPFQGSILYLEGLADSMLNHEPLFSTLSQAGYRVVSFDYPGQGGSKGSMNQTRIAYSISRANRISKMANEVWLKFRRVDGRLGTKKVVLGWSTGGLAAYEMAHRQDADAVVLIAPGIAAGLWIGEKMKITLASLTSANYASLKLKDPHVDPIVPCSPVKVPLFATNLELTSWKSRRWVIPESVKGLALLSGPKDTYVDTIKNQKVLKKNAGHFHLVNFPSALHEIDNETPEIQNKAFGEIVRFLSGL